MLMTAIHGNHPMTADILPMITAETIIPEITQAMITTATIIREITQAMITAETIIPGITQVMITALNKIKNQYYLLNIDIQ